MPVITLIYNLSSEFVLNNHGSVIKHTSFTNDIKDDRFGYGIEYMSQTGVGDGSSS